MTVYDAVPDELVARDQWVCWRNECRECGEWHENDYKGECTACGADEVTKVPKDPVSGGNARPGDPSTWTDFETARKYDENNDTHGLGFMFSADGPVVGVDIDDCRDPETGEIDDDALDILATLHSWAEISTSGTGLHVIAYGELPDGGNRRDGVEMYEGERYFAITGDVLDRSPSSINYREDELAAVHGGYVDSGSGSGHHEPVDFVIEDPPVDADVYENELGESLEEIRGRDGKLDRLLEDIEPDGYDSPSEADMATVSKLWYWTFDRETIAGIIRTQRRRPKVVERDDYLELTISKAAAGERFDPRGIDEVSILDNRSQYESIEDVDWPDGHFVLEKPPREGGSHTSIDVLIEQPTVILASRHAICEHHLDIARKVMPEGKSIVHYEGSARTCEHGGGEDCPNYKGAGGNYEELYQVIHAAKEATVENRVITKEDCPKGICRDQFISHVEEYAHAVVTVPNLLPNLERDLSGNNLLIDEEQALDYFRPPSVDLATIETTYDPDGTRRVQATESNVSSQLPTIREIRKEIQQNRAERRLEGETNRINDADGEMDVLPAAEYLEHVADAMAVEEIADELGEGATAGDVVEEIVDRLNDIPVPDPDSTPTDFRGNIEDYVERYYFDDSVDPGAMIECVLFGYDDRKFDFKFTGEGYKLRMIGGREVMHIGDLLDFQQIGIIAGPEGELFLDDLELGERSEVIEITDFRYADDFVIVPVGKQRDERMEPVSDQRDRAKRVSSILNRRAHPHFAVTGTKGRARSHHASLDKGMADIISNPDSPAKEAYTAWGSGSTAIIYENSAVSRGVDVPWFDISVVVSSGFATPYWEARMAHYRGEDQDEYEYARAIESQLKSHELTNAVLRPSPTRHVDDETGTKFIVCADWDAPRIRYIGQEVPTFAKAKSAANFLENLTIGGEYREEIEEAYWSLGGNEGDFIEASMEGNFGLSENSRPGYEIDELETWAENRYFHTEGTREEVRKAVPPQDDGVRTTYVTHLFSWSKGRVTTSLDVLERMSKIYKDKEVDDESGQEMWVWSKTPFKAD